MQNPARILIGLVVSGFILCSGAVSWGAVQTAPDDLGLFLRKYGQPDRVKVTGMGTSQVSKQLFYVAENVRVVFIQVAGPGVPASSQRWKFQNVYDLRTNRIMAPSEAARRLNTRKKR